MLNELVITNTVTTIYKENPLLSGNKEAFCLKLTVRCTSGVYNIIKSKENKPAVYELSVLSCALN